MNSASQQEVTSSRKAVSRRWIAVGLCVTSLVSCKSNKPTATLAPTGASSLVAPPADPQPTKTESTATHSPEQPKSSETSESDVARDAIAARAKRYAAEMEKAANAKAAADTKPEPQTSKVDWDDVFKNAPADDAPSSSNTAAAKPTAPVKKQVVQAPVAPTTPAAPTSADPFADAPTVTANTKVSLDGTASDGPMVVPEGTEFATVATVAAEAAVPPVAPKPVKRAPEDIAMSEQLAKRVKENPRDVSAHLDYQLLQFVQGQSVPQLAPLAPLPSEDREVIAAVMDGLSNFRTSVQNDGNQLLSKKIRPLIDISDRLRAEADLSIPTIALCRRVDGYGVYQPVEPAAFPRGRETPVILYCEVSNFSSQRADGKVWETALAHSATLYKESGVPVWSDKTTNVTDHSRNRRHDFFIVKMIKLPASLTSGRYVLKVSVVDRQSNRMAEGSMTLTIVGDEGMAQTE